MRSSSVKTLTIAVAISCTFIAAAPNAAAAPQKSSRTQPTARVSRDREDKGSVMQLIRSLLNRLTVSTQDVMNPPIPLSRN